MEEILKNPKSLPNSRLYVQAEAVQTVDAGYGPLPPALMDQLAAAAAAQYVNVTQPVVPPGPQATPQAQHPPPPQPSQPQIVRTSSGAIDAAVQTEVTTVVQSKQEMARAQIAAANRLLASTSGGGTYNSCEYCGRVFSKKEYLRRHVRIHTGERPYRCLVCQLSFRRSHHLRRHELMHTDIRPYACHACDKAFKQKQHLERHLASHTDLKPFTCSLCHKSFKQKQHLERHFQCHSDVKPYPCTICDKAFKQKQHLDRHLLCHTGEKPYSCTMCEKAFTRKQHLDRHIKMHTGELERTYKCHVCEKMFFRSHHRDKHLKSHGITALEAKRSMNFPLINIDLTKGGTVDAMNATSPHSASSDSGSDTDDDQKPPVSDKPNSQVSKMVEGCRKRKTHSPVRLTPGEKKHRSSKTTTGSNTGTNTPSSSEANGQQTPNLGNPRTSFEYSGLRNDIVFPRNEAVSAMAIRDGSTGSMGQTASTSTDAGLQAGHPMGNGSQGLEALQHAAQQQQQQQFAMAAMNCPSTAQLQQLQQMSGKVDGSTQHQDSATSKAQQPLVVPSSHFSSSSKMAELQQPKYTSAAAAIAGRQLQQAGVGVGVGVMEQPVHFKSVVGSQGTGAPHQTWPPTLNWPPRLSLMPDGSLQGMPALTTYGTVNMADLNQVSGAAMYSAQKAMEMRMGLHRSPSLGGGDAWVPVSGASDRDGQRGGPSANDRRIYSPQPNT